MTPVLHCSRCLAPMHPHRDALGPTCVRIIGAKNCNGLPVNGTPTLADFAPGDAVRYVPNHADGDLAHEDCETGYVTTVNATYVFVKFTWPRVRHFAQACKPDQLVKEFTA